MNISRYHSAVMLWLLLFCSPGSAQQSVTMGPYELFYTVVNTTFLDPKVADAYDITRGKNRAILNLAVREQRPEGSTARAMKLDGRTWDLIQSQTLQFKPIHEGEAIYYIAEFTFINEEWRFFEFDFRPEGAAQSYRFKFKHQLYIN